jgi:hypothetical protein
MPTARAVSLVTGRCVLTAISPRRDTALTHPIAALLRSHLQAEPEEETVMSQLASRPETMAEIIRLVRFAVLCTLALAAVLLLADLFGRGWSIANLRFLTETVVVTLVCGIAAQVFAAIVAVTCMALWKS